MRKNYGDIEKFALLRGYLKGSVAKVIEGLTVTGQNYKDAMKLLTDKFGNKQIIVKAHMDELLKVTQLKNERDARKYYDNFQANLRTLKGLNFAGIKFRAEKSPKTREIKSRENKLFGKFAKLNPRENKPLKKIAKLNPRENYKNKKFLIFVFLTVFWLFWNILGQKCCTG